MQAKHTPIPWAYRESSGEVESVGNVQMRICQAPVADKESPAVQEFHAANGRFITHAVNCHAELLDALADLLDNEHHHISNERYQRGYLAIRKATGEG